jgi:hypothetical protein
MKKLTFLFVAALLLVTTAATSLQAGAVADVPIATGDSESAESSAGGGATVTGAGNGVFPDGTEFSGVKLSSSTFGKIAEVYGGSGAGHFHTILAGTSLLGAAQYITVEGAVSQGTANGDGSVTFGGSAAVNMGDGTVPSVLPFSVTTTTSGLQLTLGATALPTQTLAGGSITIQ